MFLHILFHSKKESVGVKMKKGMLRWIGHDETDILRSYYVKVEAVVAPFPTDVALFCKSLLSKDCV